MESNIFSSEHTKNEVLTLASEHPYSEDDFQSKLKEDIFSSNQGFEKQEEELTEFKERQQMEPNMLSLYHTKNEVITINSETLSSDDHFETNLQAKFDKYDQILKQPE